MMKQSCLFLEHADTEFYPEVDAIIYRYVEDNKFYVIGYWSGHQEPAFWQCFLEKQHCESYIEHWIADVKNFTVAKYKQFPELRVIEQPLRKGDILVSTDELTQSIQFFEVVEIKAPHIVEVKQLSVKIEETGYLTGMVTPILHEYLSGTELVKVERLPRVLLNNQQAFLWDGKPVGCTLGQKINPDVND